MGVIGSPDQQLLRQARRLSGIRNTDRLIERSLTVLVRDELRSRLIRRLGKGTLNLTLEQLRRQRRRGL